LRLTEAVLAQYFNQDKSNLGVLLGVLQDSRRGLTDIDLDCPEAIAAWQDLGLKTKLVCGRPSARSSHFFYSTSPPVKFQKYTDGPKATLIELRGLTKEGTVGLQTVVPPSVHPTGELISFEPNLDGEPTSVSGPLLERAAARTAAAVLLARHWPAEKGGRNETFLALAGALAHADWPLAEIMAFHRAIYCALWPANPDFRAAESEVQATFVKFSQGNKVTGLPKLAEKISDTKTLDKAIRWLHLRQEERYEPTVLFEPSAARPGAKSEPPEFDEPPPSPLPPEAEPPPETEPPPEAEGPQKRGGFELRNSGVWFHSDDPKQPPIRICGYLRIMACSRDPGGENWGRLLLLRDLDGHEHRYLMSMGMLTNDGAEIREILLKGGLDIAPGRRPRGLLTCYIQGSNPTGRIRSVERTGWHGGNYVLPDITIGPHGTEELVYQAAHATEHFYRTAGTLDDWRHNVAVPCTGNSRLIFGVSAAFAGALLTPLEVEGGGFHLLHDSSAGKTTVVIVAGSVIGGGGKRGFVETWRATANGLEAIAELHNDGLLILDEINELANPGEANAVAYMLANGQGKARMSRSITARPSLRWQLLFLSSGETRLSDQANLAGRKTRAGAEIRLLNIPADAGAGMGVFEQLHGLTDAGQFANALTSAARKYYGTPFRAFLAKLVADRDHYVDQARQTLDKFAQAFLPDNAAPEVGRGLRRFALVAAAGELASGMGITGWEPNVACQAANHCYQAWLADRGGAGSFDTEAAIEQVRNFIELHGNGRFQSVTPRFDRSGEPIGEKILNRAGFWRESESGGRDYLIFLGTFKKEVCVGYRYTAVAAELEKRGYLERNQGRWTLQARAPEGARFFCVRGTILNE
jgi:uncharacterized protein (DUF927 family)